jgi:hypothetical protein
VAVFRSISARVSLASPEICRSSTESRPNALRVASMLFWIYGISRTCSFGLTTVR